MKYTKKTLNQILALFLGCLLLSSAHADEGSAALEVVKNTSMQVIDRLKDEPEEVRADPKLINQLVDELITPNFDFPKMSRWVLGKNWRKASDDQKARFTKAFQGLLIRTYSRALVESDNIDIKYLPVHASKKKKQGNSKKRRSIVPNGAPMIPINYRLYKHKNQRSVEGIRCVDRWR